MTTKRAQLSVSKRAVLGKKVKALRLVGLLPGHVFGNQIENTTIQVDAKVFAKLYKDVGETGLIDLKIEGENETRPVLVDDYALHPVTGKMLHVDFHQVNLKEKVSAMVPIEPTGESGAVKEGGVLVFAYNEVEVEALPTDLPDKFVVDLAKLDAVGSDITFGSLVYNRDRVTILDVKDEDVIVTVQAPKEEKVEEPVAPAEVEILKGATTEEGKEAAQGAPAPTQESKPEKKSDK